MAQLVKLLDYISRYENDLTRYPTQFLKLKKYHWQRMKIQWETGALGAEDETDYSEPIEEEKRQKKGFASLFRLFKQEKAPLEDEMDESAQAVPDEFDFNPNIVYQPRTLSELQRLYLDQLFHFQIKWASSTLMDTSKVAPKYMRDSLLRSFLQQLPDNYLLFYEPIIKIQKAPIQLDIILISPLECICITVLEEEDIAAFASENNRFWIKRYGDREEKILNPMLALNRMTKIVSQLFKEKELEFPIRKCLISRNGYIDYPMASYDLEVIDRRSYEEWFHSLKNVSAPLKFNQFRAAQSILDITESIAMSRLLEEEELKKGTLHEDEQDD